MTEPRYKRHLEYAEAQKYPSQVVKTFLSVAYMYMRHADNPTLGVLEGCAKDLEKEMLQAKEDK